MIDLTRDLTKHPTRYLTRDRTKLLIFGFFIVYFERPRKNESAAPPPGVWGGWAADDAGATPHPGRPCDPLSPSKEGRG